MADTKSQSMVDTMTGRFGKDVLKRQAKLGEVYGLVDVMTEAFTNHKAAIDNLQARVDALEKHGIKYAGTWQRAQSYRRGTVVTTDSAMWVALRDVAEGEAPGKALDAWQLAEKVRKRVPARRREA